MFLSQLEQAQLQSTVVSFSAAISACEQVQSWHVVIGLLAALRRRGTEPNVISYSAAVSAFEKASRWCEVLQLITEMRDQNLQPNVITYTSALGACDVSQRWEQSLWLHQDLNACRDAWDTTLEETNVEGIPLRTRGVCVEAWPQHWSLPELCPRTCSGRPWLRMCSCTMPLPCPWRKASSGHRLGTRPSVFFLLPPFALAGSQVATW
ncbi:unnamed protein product [Symbiodinium sp. CCMP2456]|nr:unnamed protein product [Symbiodinium sp. CCMP2456]